MRMSSQGVLGVSYITNTWVGTDEPSGCGVRWAMALANAGDSFEALFFVTCTYFVYHGPVRAEFLPPL